MGTQSDFLDESLEDFKELVKKPEVFLSSNSTLPDTLKTNLKGFYDLLKTQEKQFKGSQGLPKLLINNFDTEQIWQEIELQNNSILSKSVSNVTRLVVNKNKLVFSDLLETQNKNDANGNLSVEEEEGIDEQVKDKSDDEAEAQDEIVESEDEEMENNDNTPIFSSRKKSVVDDEFFKLDEMENFLNLEEKKDQPNTLQKSSKNAEEESESDDEESIDLFEQDEDEDNLEIEADKSRTAKFKDFFKSNDPERKDVPKRNKFLKEFSDNEDDQQVKSAHELRQERLKKRIEEIEENAVSEKPWTLKGEIRANNRPQNSLLEEILEFDLTSRPAPVITQNTTLQLEDVIKQRIKDKAFDSVERKAKPIETPLEYKKKLTLDQEKSKHSLAQIYEKEYLDQQAALDPENAEKDEEEPTAHKEIRTMLRDLFNKLDALSNFHFTPKPALPELRVVNNLPAITMEEVAPVTSNEASLLAPEEIRNKTKGEILGETERTKTDKNRARRIKKLKQMKHKQTISKNLLAKGKVKTVDVLKNKNTHKMDETNSKSIKSSKAFFTQLQEQAQAHIGKKLGKTTKKKEKNKLDAKKLKL